MIKNVLLVGVGGGLGSIARYIFQRLVSTGIPGAFPWATFIVNITGCLLIGIFWGLSFKPPETDEHWKIFLMTGICGGFTTFSAFTFEGIGLMKEQKHGLLLLYIAASVLSGLLATYAGMRIIK